MTDGPTAADRDAGIWSRTTAPQSTFTTGDVGLGILVLVIGLLLTFGLPVGLS